MIHDPTLYGVGSNPFRLIYLHMVLLMKRAFTNILTHDVAATAAFYEDLLGLTRSGDFGWFIILSDDGLPGFELGILDKDHESVPDILAWPPAGAILTFVVDDVEELYREAIANGAEIIQPPTDLFYGQRRLMLRDPTGTAVDISSPIR